VLTLKIEGRVVGEWASELERVWASIRPSLNHRKLSLDICDLLYLDGKGKEILRGIVETSDTEIKAGSPLTKQFADEAKQNMRKRNREGNKHAMRERD
jgi:hypothetical protein